MIIDSIRIGAVLMCMSKFAGASPLHSLSIDTAGSADIMGARPEHIWKDKRDAPNFDQNTISALDAVMPDRNDAIDGDFSTTAGTIPIKLTDRYCNLEQQHAIWSSWHDSRDLVNNMSGYPDYDWDKVRTQWLGKEWNNRDDKHTGQFVGNVLHGITNLYSKNFRSNKKEYIYFYCTDYANQCDDQTYAYTEDKDWNLWRSHYINLCPLFFNKNLTTDLHETLNRYSNDKERKGIIDNFQTTQAATLLHETFHFFPTVSNPGLIDLSYSAKRCEQVARENGTDYAKFNAESWTLLALGSYVQRWYGLSAPPIANQSAPSMLSTMRSKKLNNTAAGLKTFPDNTTPDPSRWISWDDDSPDPLLATTTAAALPTPSLSCADNPTKWTPRDPLNSAIPVFCAEAEKQGVADRDAGGISRFYLDGNDRVHLALDWPQHSAQWNPKKDECVKYLSTVMDSCNTGNDNPMNWKHGGFMTAGNAKYTITPQVDRKYTPGICSFHVHEEEHFWGSDSLDLERTRQYTLRDNMLDGNKKVISSIQNDVDFGDGNPWVDHSYYAPLYMTPEGQNGDYIQFTIGSTSWTTKDRDGKANCKVGDWDSHYTPIGRDMDCSFPC